MELARVKQATPFTVSNQWSEGGVNVDPGTVTIGITRADGSVLVAPGTSTSGAGVAARTFALTTTHTAQLDRLKITWTTSLKGVDTSYVEVVGGFLFTIAELRDEDPLGDAAKYPTDDLVYMRTVVEQSFEKECGRAFVPRYELEVKRTYRPTLSRKLQVSWPLVRAIRSATVDGRVLAAGELATVQAYTTGLFHPSGWARYGTESDITVGYEHGYDFPPGFVSEAAKLLAKNWLVKGPVDDRMTSMSNDDGTFSLATPGLRGSRYGIPEVDAVVNGYGAAVLV